MGNSISSEPKKSSIIPSTTATPCLRFVVTGQHGREPSSLCNAIMNVRPSGDYFPRSKRAASRDWQILNRHSSSSSSSSNDLPPLTIRVLEAGQTPFSIQHQIFKPYNVCVLVMEIDLEEQRDNWWGSLSQAEAWALSVGKHIEHSVPVLVVFSLRNYREDKDREFKNRMKEVWEDLMHQDSVRVDEATKAKDEFQSFSGKVAKLDFKEYVGVAYDPDSPDSVYNTASTYNIEAVQDRIVELARSEAASHPMPEKLPRILELKEEFLRHNKPVVSIEEFLETLGDGSDSYKRPSALVCYFRKRRKKKQPRRAQKMSPRAASMSEAIRSAMEAANSIGEVIYDEALLEGVIILDPTLFEEMWKAMLAKSELYPQQGANKQDEMTPAHDFKYVSSKIAGHSTYHRSLHLEGILTKNMLPHILCFKNGVLGGFSRTKLRAVFFEALRKMEKLIPLKDGQSQGGGRRSVGEGEERYLFPERFIARAENWQSSSGQRIEEYDIENKLVLVKQATLLSTVPPSLFSKLLYHILSLIWKKCDEEVDLARNLVLEEGHMQYKFSGWPNKERCMWLLLHLNELNVVRLTIAANHPRQCDQSDAVVDEIAELLEQVCYALELVLASHDCYVDTQRLGGGVNCRSKDDRECFSGIEIIFIKEEDLQHIKGHPEKQSGHILSEAQLKCLIHLLNNEPRLCDIRRGIHPNFDKKRREYERGPEHPEYIVFVPPETSEDRLCVIKDVLNKLCGPRAKGSTDQVSSPSSAPPYILKETPNPPTQAEYFKIYRCHPFRNLYIHFKEYDGELMREDVNLMEKLYASHIKFTITGKTDQVDGVSGGLHFSDLGMKSKGVFSRSTYRSLKFEDEFEIIPKKSDDGSEVADFPLTELDRRTLLRDGGLMKELAESRLSRGGESIKFKIWEKKREVQSRKDIELAMEAVKLGVKFKFQRVRKTSITTKIRASFLTWDGSSWNKPDTPEKSKKSGSKEHRNCD